MLQFTGDTYENINCAGPGCIVALSGLKSTRTGDILGPVLANSSHSGTHEDQEDGAPVPQPVVHAALEPRSSSAFRNLEHALKCMQREDPSFKVGLTFGCK